MNLRMIPPVLILCLLPASLPADSPAENLLKKPDDWFRGEEGRKTLDCVLSWQTEHGDWPKNMDTTRKKYAGEGKKPAGTFDNEATIGELRVLARAFQVAADERYQQAFLRGLDHVLKAQYPNGGWPQFYPLSTGYHRHITFNDGTMIRVMEFLRDVAACGDYEFLDQERSAAAGKAVERGLDCILKCQVVVQGTPTVWCAQHHAETLAPVQARSYEHPSLSGAESAGVLLFLMSLDQPTPDVIRAVKAGVAWYDSAKIAGYRYRKSRTEPALTKDPEASPLWARFYEIKSNRPIFSDRDGIVKYDIQEIGGERRGGYTWYGGWGDPVAKAYARWQGGRRRVIMSSDFPPIGVVKGGNVPNDQKSDPDDMQSMVRFLLYANEFDIEGLIASSGTFANKAEKQHILDVIDRYEIVYDNLKKHDPLYPAPDKLRSVTFEGRSGTWGKKGTVNIGEGKDSAASDALISIVDEPDPRPVYIGVWGDCSVVAQAVWKVQHTRSAAELEAFLGKLRIHQIATQDGTIGWLRDNFPKLFIIHSHRTYQGMFGGSDPNSNLAWVNENIRNSHGPLCAVYPHEGMGCTGVCEGDSPAFLWLVSANRGLNDPDDPTQES